VAAVNAQTRAAKATSDYIADLIKDGKPIMVDFTVDLQETKPPDAEAGKAKPDAGKTKTVKISAPLLAMVPIPHLRIDSLTTHFKYEISQIAKSTRAKDATLEAGAQTGALLSPWVSATLKGSVASRSSDESTVNRSGVLEITVHASEAPMPEGLAKILGILADSVKVTPAS
jgi:hypothetical protein